MRGTRKKWAFNDQTRKKILFSLPSNNQNRFVTAMITLKMFIIKISSRSLWEVYFNWLSVADFQKHGYSLYAEKKFNSTARNHHQKHHFLFGSDSDFPFFRAASHLSHWIIFICFEYLSLDNKKSFSLAALRQKWFHSFTDLSFNAMRHHLGVQFINDLTIMENIYHFPLLLVFMLKTFLFMFFYESLNFATTNFPPT